MQKLSELLNDPASGAADSAIVNKIGISEAWINTKRAMQPDRNCVDHDVVKHRYVSVFVAVDVAVFVSFCFSINFCVMRRFFAAMILKCLVEEVRGVLCCALVSRCVYPCVCVSQKEAGRVAVEFGVSRCVSV